MGGGWASFSTHGLTLDRLRCVRAGPTGGETRASRWHGRAKFGSRMEVGRGLAWVQGCLSPDAGSVGRRGRTDASGCGRYVVLLVSISAAQARARAREWDRRLGVLCATPPLPATLVVDATVTRLSSHVSIIPPLLERPATPAPLDSQSYLERTREHSAPRRRVERAAHDKNGPRKCAVCAPVAQWWRSSTMYLPDSDSVLVDTGAGSFSRPSRRLALVRIPTGPPRAK